MEKGRIVCYGLGGFLNPPGHPEHNRSVETDLGRRPENRGGMSLSAAVESDWLDHDTRKAARTLLAEWWGKRRPLEPMNTEEQDWIRQVLGYFKGCYKGQDKDSNGSWNASDLQIDSTLDPMLNSELHAGVHLIREYYPDYMPKAEHFTEAYWGTKPKKEDI